ncbi:MAG: polyribonucleotide nucleotidyltransferase [Parcubacteria group bacterium]|nr:polyribonucleotide nucleotidyltransferase [Parcubacteria group bacterium]
MYMDIQTFETQWGGRTLSVEVGRMALQASASCTVRYGDTVVMATTVMGQSAREGIDWFPLMVDFDEKLYAAGIIKGSRFIKREGRPTDTAVLTSRMIDRTIRPLFDASGRKDVQVVVTPLSVDGENDPDILGIIGASIALSISDIPWEGPIGGIRVGRIASEEGDKKEWVINPTYEARLKSELDLIVCGTHEMVIMVEAEANEVNEADMVEAIEFGQKHLKEVVGLINTIVKKVGKKKQEPDVSTPELEEIYTQEQHAKDLAVKFLDENAPGILYEKPLVWKKERKAAFAIISDKLDEHLTEKQVAQEAKKKILSNLKYMIGRVVSDEIIKNKRRIDGRSVTETRELSSLVGTLPRTHGTGLFNRGETQVLSIVTLGSPGDVQTLEGIEGASKKRYMHHYNFPAFSVGEARPNRGPSRRDIGHGSLAEKALLPVLPNKEDFPYTIRVVSEVFGSNGSSSMASACGSSLSLMDAGVPITKTVGGVAMGLASNDKGEWQVITDLQDLEDGEGGMDFKITGTRDGITAIQMDTKTLGLNKDIVKATIHQALDGRVHVIESMEKAIKEARADLSPYAPRIETLHIDPEMIRVVIGPGGKQINEIIDTTGVSIDIEQDGTVFVASENGEQMKVAIEWIERLTKKIEAGEEYEGKVVRIMDFGAFVELTPGTDGLVHVSELAWSRTENVTDVVKLGDIVKVKVKEVGDDGKIKLSIKDLLPKPEGYEDRKPGTGRGGRPPRRDDHGPRRH